METGSPFIPAEKRASIHALQATNFCLATAVGLGAALRSSNVYEATLSAADLPDGLYPLHVRVEDASGKSDSDSIRISIRATAPPIPPRQARNQDNTIGPWPQHGILGTQLGPNKSGRRW